jgi:hypothetical protein
MEMQGDPRMERETIDLALARRLSGAVRVYESRRQVAQELLTVALEKIREAEQAAKDAGLTVIWEDGSMGGGPVSWAAEQLPRSMNSLAIDLGSVERRVVVLPKEAE